jgi:hypothetical protein
LRSFEDMVDNLMERYLVPIAMQLFPGVAASSGLDHHHAFTVQYKVGEDRSLDMHIDDSEVTVNVNINDRFEGACLNFCGHWGSLSRRKHSLKYHHRLGWCVIHLGRHRHGAAEITSGTRNNLIIWMKSRDFRRDRANLLLKSELPTEKDPPDLVCLSETHDDDVAEWRDVLAAGFEEGKSR